jgi:hypothetical protein
MLHSDGWTRVGAQGSPDAGVVMPLFGEDNMGRGGGLQLVRGGNRVAGVFTVTGASGTTVRLISCPANLEGLCQHALLGAGDMPTVSISATGELAAAAWRRDGGLVLGGFPLATMDWNAPSTSWTVVDVADSSGEVEPQLLGDPSVELRLYSLDPVGADGGPPALVFRGPGATCADGSCVGELASPSVRMETIAPGTGTRMPGDLAASRDGSGGKDLLAYQVGSGTTAEVWMAAHADGGWLEPATRLPGQAASPLWVLPDMLYLESNGALAKDLACHP